MVDIPALLQGVIVRHTPEVGIDQWEHEVLIAQFLMARHWVRRGIILILIQADPAADWKDTLQKATWMADTLSPPKLQDLFDICQDERPIIFLLKARLDTLYRAEELRRRLREKDVGWQFVQVLGKLATSEVLNGLLEKLKVDRMTTYHNDEEDDTDLQGLALKSAFEVYTKMKQDAGFPVPAMIVQKLPPDCGLPEMEPPPWDVLNAHILPLEWLESLQSFLPILDDQVKTLPSKVHDALKDHWAKWKAQKRQAKREYKTVEELDKLRQLPWHDPAPPRAMSQMALAYRRAEERWGKKGTAFLEALCEEYNVGKASKKAGISRPTAYKYLKELRKDLSPSD